MLKLIVDSSTAESLSLHAELNDWSGPKYSVYGIIDGQPHYAGVNAFSIDAALVSAVTLPYQYYVRDPSNGQPAAGVTGWRVVWTDDDPNQVDPTGYIQPTFQSVDVPFSDGSAPQEIVLSTQTEPA